ncbi:hypothetical protein [Undibacterium sp. TS12]|uniref:DUF6916 family protein n=1 Tax=Undibacterium sp. TS12 TaxID=2908202 RepID=UPI001F4C82D3|nr:hypothetical protein [Undibacterium sp. TS12]MCH8622894.1 hypothetical protein [Undibacterium sp. TS12]
MTITFEQMQALVGDKFGVQTTAGIVELTLIEAEERPRRGLPEQFRTPLSLIFTGPSQFELAQANFPFDHPVLGHQIWTFVPTMPAPEKGQHANRQADGSFTVFYQVLFS